MPPNVLLVRWANGWREVKDDAAIAEFGERVEAALGLGTVQTVGEVELEASAELARFAHVRVAHTVSYDPRTSGELPYVSGWRPGDSPTVEGVRLRTLSMTVRRGPGGRAEAAPQFGDEILKEEDAAFQAQKKMINGTLRGASKLATPVGLVARATVTQVPPPTDLTLTLQKQFESSTLSIVTEYNHAISWATGTVIDPGVVTSGVGILYTVNGALVTINTAGKYLLTAKLRWVPETTWLDVTTMVPTIAVNFGQPEDFNVYGSGNASPARPNDTIEVSCSNVRNLPAGAIVYLAAQTASADAGQVFGLEEANLTITKVA